MRGKKIILTEAEKQYLQANYHNTKNSELATTLNISQRAINRIAVQLGLRKDKDFCRLITKTNIDKMLAANKANRWESQRRHLLNNIKKGILGNRFKKGESYFKQQPLERQKEIIAKRVASFKKTRERAILRANWGFDIGCKLRLFSNKKRVCARYRLKLYGYQIEKEKNDTFIVPTTNRNLKLENRYNEIYKFKFVVN